MSAVSGKEYTEGNVAVRDTVSEESGSPEKRCYTVEDLQIILGISRGSVYELLKKQLPVYFKSQGGS